jgi:hypothetical protein
MPMAWNHALRVDAFSEAALEFSHFLTCELPRAVSKPPCRLLIEQVLSACLRPASVKFMRTSHTIPCWVVPRRGITWAAIILIVPI